MPEVSDAFEEESRAVAARLGRSPLRRAKDVARVEDIHRDDLSEAGGAKLRASHQRDAHIAAMLMAHGSRLNG